MLDAQLDTVFRAFADQTRRRILNLLREGELCVGDLVSILKAPQPTISRHLAYLRREGLVDVAHEGTWCFYSLAMLNSAFHRRLIESLGECLAETPQLRRDITTLGVFPPPRRLLLASGFMLEFEDAVQDLQGHHQEMMMP